MTIFVFPGQGSQTKEMGKDLFPLFPDLVKQASTVLGYDIAELCLTGGDRLNQTNFTQPALFTVNALHYLKKKSESGKNPDYVLGHSLGEYNAYFAAGVCDFITGLQLVKKRGELMSRSKGGAMAAIIGPKSDDISKALLDAAIPGISVANFNSYTQTVVTGTQEAVTRSKTVFEPMNALFFPLNVTGAFHSPLMKEAQSEFSEYIRQFKLNPPVIPIIANITAKPLENADLQSNLVSQITDPVRWLQSVSWLLEKNQTDFEELGPGKVLTGLIQKIKQGK